MTSILKSDSNSKNGIILKESTKKFVEATSTSGCDSEMSEITSSIPHSLSLNTVVSENSTKNGDLKDFPDTKIIEISEVTKPSVSTEITYELEDIIDGFSIFSFVTDEDLMKFSVKHDKVNESINESDCNNKNKKFARTKKQIKIFKNSKESTCNDECIDIYDFQANSESSPSSKHSSVIFKKSINKGHSTKYVKKSKYKFKNENNSSLSEENSSNTSVTESHNLSVVDGHNDSPQPTSNDDNNVVSTTTPDNLNIELRKSESLNNSSKSHSPALKTASLRLFKLEDELSMTGLNRTEKSANNTPSASTVVSENEKILNSQLRLNCTDEKYQSKIVPTKFSVDLLTTVTDRQSVVTDESNLCLNNNNNNNNLKNSPEIDIINSAQPVSTNIRANNLKSIDSNSIDIQSAENVKMSSAGVKHVSGINCRSTTPFRDTILDSNGLYSESRLGNTNNSSHYLNNDEESLNEKLLSEKAMNSGLLASSFHKDVDVSQNAIASWLNLQYNKSLYNNNNAPGQHSKNLLQANSNNYSMMPPKATNSYNSLKNSTNNSNNHSNSTAISNSNNNNNNGIHNSSGKLHDSTIDWPNNYFDSAKMLPSSMQKFNPSIGSLSYDLTNNIRYQQEQQDLMNALRLKHENAKISKPLVQLGIDGMYKLDPTTFKGIDSRFQNHNSNSNNYFMPNAQMHIDFNSTNVFKSRSDTRSRHNCTDPITNKPLPALSSSSASNFKTPETAKKRGHWCDMHVKIAYFIYRSQKRLSMTKSQEINAQLPHLMYADKIPSATPTPSITQYPSNLLQHSNPYLDFRSSQLKNDSNFLNYQSKSSSAFPSSPIRPLNSYPYMLPQNLDLDIPPGNPIDDHHQTAEQKWMRLLNQYMTNHPLSNVDRTNIDAMNQFYLWCQQFTQSNNSVPHFNPSIPTSPLQTPNIDANSVYVRKYMEQLSSYLGSLKNEGNAYINNAMAERDMHILLMKQQHQQYQKAMLSKYQSPMNKSTNLPSHINPLINPVNSFYSKMKPINSDPMIPHYPDCNPSLINHKYRITHDQLRQLKYDQMAANHHMRNGYSKPPENINPKRRKLNNSDSTKTFQVDLLTNEKESTKLSTDLSPEHIPINNNGSKNNVINNNNNNNSNNNNNTSSNNNINNSNTTIESRSSNSRDNSSFHLQAVASESRD